jgi:hypothetical protein
MNDLKPNDGWIKIFNQFQKIVITLEFRSVNKMEKNEWKECFVNIIMSNCFGNN